MNKIQKNQTMRVLKRNQKLNKPVLYRNVCHYHAVWLWLWAAMETSYSGYLWPSYLFTGRTACSGL